MTPLLDTLPRLSHDTGVQRLRVRVSKCVRCTGFPCSDVDHGAYAIPSVELDPRSVRIILISEAAPPDRAEEPRVIPSGSTYKIRSGQYSFRGTRAFPSYLQAGPSFLTEKSKRRMIAQDIAAALRIAGSG